MLPLCSCPLWVNAATHPWKISLATNPDHLPDPSSDRTELRATLGPAGFDVTYGAAVKTDGEELKGESGSTRLEMKDLLYIPKGLTKKKQAKALKERKRCCGLGIDSAMF